MGNARHRVKTVKDFLQMARATGVFPPTGLVPTWQWGNGPPAVPTPAVSANVFRLFARVVAEVPRARNGAGGARKSWASAGQRAINVKKKAIIVYSPDASDWRFWSTEPPVGRASPGSVDARRARRRDGGWRCIRVSEESRPSALDMQRIWLGARAVGNLAARHSQTPHFAAAVGRDDPGALLAEMRIDVVRSHDAWFDPTTAGNSSWAGVTYPRPPLLRSSGKSPGFRPPGRLTPNSHLQQPRLHCAFALHFDDAAPLERVGILQLVIDTPRHLDRIGQTL